MVTANIYDSDLQSLFDKFVGQYGPQQTVSQRISATHHIPSLDAHETDKEYIVQMELPGMSKQDIEMNIHEGTLSVSGESKRSTEFKEGASLVRERSYGKFSRSIKMPTHIQADKISAKYENGVLEVKLPKAESQQKKKIAIA